MKSTATITPFPTPLRKRVPPLRQPVLGITLVALLAPALGGSTQLWTQALLVLALAVLLIVAPPKRSPGPIWTAVLAGLALLIIPSFLPSTWFPLPAWRLKLASDFEATLPTTYSAQPWLSVEAGCLLFSGLVFTACLLSLDWDSQSRRRALRIYTIGIVVLAAAALLSYFTKSKVPFWPEALNSPINFGFFPNRNQTANVMALAGIVSIALAYDSFERQRRAGWLWLAAVLLLGVALVINFSRAGIVIFLAGGILWIVAAFAISSSRQGMALSVGGLALLLTLFFLFGGRTLQRFQSASPDSPPDYRVPIQTDALQLAGAAPWLGQGLGNFEPVFAMVRNASADQNRAIHPESDWLWVAVEMGWPAVALLGIGALYWLRSCFPLSEGQDRHLRNAAMICGIGFLLHGFIDVSGHRLGAAWPGLFLASLAMIPSRRPAPQHWAAPVFRLAGVVLAAMAAWWIASLFSEKVNKIAPTSHTLSRLVARMEKQTTEGAFPDVLESTTEALRIAPLDWRVFYHQGVAHAALSDLPWVAVRDFHASRLLEPRWVDSCYREGKLWISIKQYDFAIDAWAETLRRAGQQAPTWYAQMLANAGPSFTIHTALQELARTDVPYLLAFLQHADRLECDTEIARLLDLDPKLASLTIEERKQLFYAWFHHGDRDLLITTLLEKPDWLADGWIWVALDDAEKDRFERAYALARQYGVAPALPELTSSKSLNDLEQQFRYHPGNFREGLELFFAQRKSGQNAEAVETLVALQTIPGHPAYVSYLEGELRASMEQWPEAWNAWRRFAGTDFR